MRRTWARQRAQLFGAAASAGAGVSDSARPVSHGPPTGRRTRRKPAGRARRRRAAAHAAVGRDYKRRPIRKAPGLPSWVPILAGALVAALLLVSVRLSNLRLRYELAEALTEETALLERRRALSVTVGELRSPARLQRQARALGLGRPDRVVDLPPPTATP